MKTFYDKDGNVLGTFLEQGDVASSSGISYDAVFYMEIEDENGQISDPQITLKSGSVYEIWRKLQTANLEPVNAVLLLGRYDTDRYYCQLQLMGVDSNSGSTQSQVLIFDDIGIVGHTIEIFIDTAEATPTSDEDFTVSLSPNAGIIDGPGDVGDVA